MMEDDSILGSEILIEETQEMQDSPMTFSKEVSKFRNCSNREAETTNAISQTNTDDIITCYSSSPCILIPGTDNIIIQLLH